MSDTNADNIRGLGEGDANLHQRGDRIMLVAAGVLAVGVLIFTYIASAPVREGTTQAKSFGPVEQQREFIIKPGATASAFEIFDAETMALVRRYGSDDDATSSDFLNGQLPIMLQRRRIKGLDQSAPFRLATHENGAKVWSDTLTGERMQLHRMGPVARQSVMPLLER